MKLFKTISILTLLTLVGCASTNEINMLADHRATVLKSKLPLQYGPLNITDAKSDGNVVEILMIYNEGGSISAQELIDGSIKSYCSNDETRFVINKGVAYRIIMRNERGSLIADTPIHEAVCRANNF